MNKSILSLLLIIVFAAGCATTPTATQESISDSQFNNITDCIEIESAMPNYAKLTGTVISYDRTSYKSSSTLGYRETKLQNLGTMDIEVLAKADDPFLYMKISPSRKLMAYYRPVEEELQIADSNHQVIKRIAWDREKWKYITGWLDDQRVVIELSGTVPSTLLVLDIASGQEKLLIPNFPDIYALDTQFNWNGWGETVYDSTLSQVVYASYPTDSYYYALWDMNIEQSIAVLPPINTIISFARGPKWSPDDSQVVMPSTINFQGQASEELFSVSREGKITQLTNLSRYYKSVGFTRMSWSPDGRYIAFYFLASMYFEGEQLAIVDTVSNETVNICIPGLQTSEYHEIFPPMPSTFLEFLPAPIWSPDGQQLLVENRFAVNGSRLILIDIVQGFAAEIGKNLEPIGWMVNP